MGDFPFQNCRNGYNVHRAVSKGEFELGVSVNAVSESGERWLVDLRVYEGVYRKNHYPVRVVEVPAPPPHENRQELEHKMAEFALTEVRLHMQSGSLPPKGMQVNGHRAWQMDSAETSSITYDARP